MAFVIRAIAWFTAMVGRLAIALKVVFLTLAHQGLALSNSLPLVAHLLVEERCVAMEGQIIVSTRTLGCRKFELRDKINDMSPPFSKRRILAKAFLSTLIACVITPGLIACIVRIPSTSGPLEAVSTTSRNNPSAPNYAEEFTTTKPVSTPPSFQSVSPPACLIDITGIGDRHRRNY